MELRTRASDYVVLYCQRAASYGQTRIYDILKFVSAQSTPAPRPAQVVH
jgi:receptor expression-enhancing protein 1/2/3/4